MGDKSPKAARKQASQKQAKSDRVDQKKRQDVVATSGPIPGSALGAPRGGT
jgi:hypothetical protein